MNDIFIKNGISIPIKEIDITTSRAGGPGGQHVNKTNTRVTLRWNIKNSNVLTDDQKNYLIEKLKHILTLDADLIIHNNATRSQLQNKKLALNSLAQIIKKGLYVQKKRVATKIPKTLQESRLKEKKGRSQIKKLRHKIYQED